MRWIGLLSLVLACSHDKSAPPPAKDPPPAATRLFTDAEIDASTKEVLARIAENAKRSCPGPKLLGEPTPGASAPELVALFEAQGPLAACLTRIREVAKPQYANRAPEDSPSSSGAG